MTSEMWITTYPPKTIKEHLTNVGFFHKVLPCSWFFVEEDKQ